MAVRIGDRATSASPLYPSGRVLIDGQSFVARSVDGSIDANVETLIVGGDRFSLLVRLVTSVESPESLVGFGSAVLLAKEQAAVDAERANDARRQAELEWRRDRILIAVKGLGIGFVIGIALVVIQTLRVGYSEELLIVPLISAVGMGALGVWFLILGVATHEMILFAAIVAALIGLGVGTFLFGPTVGVLSSLAVGFLASLTALLFAALEAPHDG